jgi:hypothetical protein
VSHTPGPWTLSPPLRSGASHTRRVETMGGEYVLFLEQLEMNACMPAFDANARLIAAAPELLEALKGLLVVFEEEYGGETEKYQSRAAIAKAEGK